MSKKYDKYSDDDIIEAMRQNAKTMTTEATFIEDMRSGKYVHPRDSESREQVIESHRKIMQKLKNDNGEMLDELMRRWEGLFNRK